MGTIKPTLLHREIFELDIEKYVENMYVWKWGSHCPGRGGSSTCKDKEGNNVWKEREHSVLLRCRGPGREMAGLRLEGWIWAPSWSTSDAMWKRLYLAGNRESESLSRGNMVKSMF